MHETTAFPRSRAMRLRERAILAAVVLSAGACTAASRVAPSAAMRPVASQVDASTGAMTATGVDAQATDRLLVRRAHLRVEVERPADAAARVASIATAAGGYVQSQAAASEGSASLVLRVPVARLDAILDSVGSTGKVRERSVAATDVTEESVDLEARLQAMRATRDRLRQLLERAATVTDVVTVERELARVQAELDAREARLRVLRGQVALAEVSVALDRRRVLGPLGLLFVGVGTLLSKLFVIQE